MNIIDILLIFTLIFLIYNLINNRNYTVINDKDNILYNDILSNNVISDDDIIIINNEDTKKQRNDINKLNESHETFENSNLPQDQKYLDLYSKKKYKSIYN